MEASVMNPPAPTTEDIFRYRYQHGTNLGSIFVLEKWLHRSMHEKGSSGSSELSAVTQYAWHCQNLDRGDLDFELARNGISLGL
jgi:hypothetical protein